MSKHGTKKWLMFALRWGIAFAGITYVVLKINFHDHVKVLDEQSLKLVDMRVMGDAPEDAVRFRVWGQLPAGSKPHAVEVMREQVWTDRSDRSTIEVLGPDGKPKALTVKGIRPASAGGAMGSPIAPKVLAEDPETGTPEIVDPAEVVVLIDGSPKHGRYHVPPYPLVEIGLSRMAREANWYFLLAALAVMPISYLLTSYRWYVLMDVLDVHVSKGRTFVINMVGSFYNSFMPGSTGGDVVKAYYASRHTPHRTRAVMSVLVDRAIGLLALVMLGGTMAALQYRQSVDCQRVAKVSGLLVAVTAIGLVAFYSPRLRRATGLAWLIGRLPMQKFIQNAVHAMELYGRRPVTMLGVLLLCFPVHITTIISATFAGHAFGMTADKVPNTYYWVIVPVIALVGAIPISLQGAGVMEFFAIKLLTVRHPVSVGQAVALVMAIRLVSMSWNLVAGLFVLRGGYHAPTEAEQHELEADVDTERDEEPAAVDVAVGAVAKSPVGP